MTAEQNRRRRPMLDAERSRPLEEPVHRRTVKLSWSPAETVRSGEPRKQFEVDFLGEPAERAIADLVADLEPRPGLQMVRDQTSDLPPHVVSIDRPDIH